MNPVRSPRQEKIAQFFSALEKRGIVKNKCLSEINWLLYKGRLLTG